MKVMQAPFLLKITIYPVELKEFFVGIHQPPFGINSPSNTQTYPPNFNDFKVMVNGSQVEYFTEVKAVTESGEDISNFLVEKKINYKTFAGFDIFPLADGLINSPSELPNYEINALTKVDRQYLVEKGALSEDGMPLWDNKITYYWRQKFPAGEVTKISHKYTPYVGGAFTYEHFENSFDNAGSACIDPKLRERMSGYLNGDSGFPQKFNRRVDFTTVSYILVTANSWKMPIKKFELIIRKQASNAKENRKPYISLCWDGNLKKVSETEFKSEMLNFKPNKDLLIYWYYLN